MGNLDVLFPVIETSRLILREIRHTDLEDLFEVFSSEEVMLHYGQYPHKNKEATLDCIEYFSKGYTDDRLIRWGIELKSEGKLIGTCGFHNWNKVHKRADIGYELNKSHWRNGYISEALVSIFNYGFKDLDINRIQALVNPMNDASSRCLIKLGFSDEGILKEFAYHRDRFVDLRMLSLIKGGSKLEAQS